MKHPKFLGSKIYFWLVLPFVVLGAGTMAFTGKEAFEAGRTTGGLISVYLSFLCVLGFYGMLSEKHGSLCGRIIAASVAIGYLAYFIETYFFQKLSLASSGRNSDATPFNAILGFIAIGLPCIKFAITGTPFWKTKKINPNEAMRELRLKVLTLPPHKIEIKPTPEYPRIYGILLDWPTEKTIVSIMSLCNGDASIYTTSSFGIIGGVTHETVRIAAAKFVSSAEEYFDNSLPTSDYSYPTADKIKFFLLTFKGVRVINAELASVWSGQDKYSDLFGMGQAVLTQLRLISEKNKSV